MVDRESPSYIGKDKNVLVLNREPGEEIVIDGCIVVKILSQSDTGVRVGIQAPREIPVHRREVQDRLDAEREANNE